MSDNILECRYDGPGHLSFLTFRLPYTCVCLATCSAFLCIGCFCPHVDEHQPSYTLEKSWKNPVPSPTAEIQQKANPDNWWEVFGDEKLNAIVTEGLQNSPSITQAMARLDQALCLTTITGSNQYPQLSLNGYGDRRRIPKDLRTSAQVPTGKVTTPKIPTPPPPPPPPPPPLPPSPPLPTPTTGVPPIVVPAIPVMKTVKTPTHVNDLIANLFVNYEIDFWGKYYLQTQAAERRAEAAGADLATIRLLLADQIAATYFTIQAMDAELALIRNEIATHEERVALLAQQCELGLTDAFGLLGEQATLETRKAEEQALIQSKDVNLSLLAVLVGREPNSASFDIKNADWNFPIIPPGVPSLLLAKRPDVRASMKEVEALIAEIGAAKTELLPTISLSAAAGFQAGVAHEWFKWKDRIWSLAASVGQPLFDAGRRLGEVDAAKARFREAAGTLTQTVLTSVKEVEDALVAIRTQRERRTAALKREEELSSTAMLRSDLCTTGIQDYVIVLQAKENLLQAKRDRVNEEFNLQLGTLALMKSLGGSWEQPTPIAS